MKKNVLCLFVFILYLLVACTIISGWIEEAMMTCVELGPVNTRATHKLVLRELPDRALFEDGAGRHLYEVYDGSGWEGGKRIREVSGWTMQGDGIVTVSGYPDTAYVFSGTRQPKGGEEVRPLETRERENGTYLLIYEEAIPEDTQFPLETVSYETKDNVALLVMRDFSSPFMEQRVKTASEGTGLAERIFRIEDAEQFLNQLPRLAGAVIVLAAGCLFLAIAWCIPGMGSVKWGNGGLSVLCLCLLSGLLKKIVLPHSLLPENNILEIGHYRTELETLFTGLAKFPDAFSALTKVWETALSASGWVLCLGAAFLGAILVLEYRLRRTV